MLQVALEAGVNLAGIKRRRERKREKLVLVVVVAMAIAVATALPAREWAKGRVFLVGSLISRTLRYAQLTRTTVVRFALFVIYVLP
jgi:hypothetical protein